MPSEEKARCNSVVITSKRAGAGWSAATAVEEKASAARVARAGKKESRAAASDFAGIVCGDQVKSVMHLDCLRTGQGQGKGRGKAKEKTQ